MNENIIIPFSTREKMYLKKLISSLENKDNLISELKNILNIYSNISVFGEEYEMAEYDILCIKRKLELFSDQCIIYNINNMEI